MSTDLLSDTPPVVNVDIPVLSFPDTVSLLLDQYGCLNPMERAAELCAEGTTRFYAGGTIYRATTTPDRELDTYRHRSAPVPPEIDALCRQSRFSHADALFVRAFIHTMLETRARYPEGEQNRWVAMHSPTIGAIGSLRQRVLAAEARRGRPEPWEVAGLNALLRPLGLVPLPTTTATRR